MLERQKRLNEVYNYLHSNKGIHTKAGFADAIKYARRRERLPSLQVILEQRVN